MIIPAVLLSQESCNQREEAEEFKNKDMQEILDSVPFPREQIELTRNLMVEVGAVPAKEWNENS